MTETASQRLGVLGKAAHQRQPLCMLDIILDLYDDPTYSELSKPLSGNVGRYTDMLRIKRDFYKSFRVIDKGRKV